ncbi:MAG: hypothetical protein SGI87_00560, partial [Flavobacteriales bacterium]|nr:hypothetical protein [Flavobacteriales bacterium]
FVVIILNPSSLGATSYYISLSRSQKLAREAGALPSNTLEDVAPTELLVEIHTEKENDRRMSLLWILVILPILHIIPILFINPRFRIGNLL